jgi:transposase
MASKTRRNFTDEFKAETVALLESSDRSLSQVAQDLGIEQSVLARLAAQVAAIGTQSPRSSASTGNVHAAAAPAITADQAEIRRLRRELDRVRWSATF